MGRVTEHYDSVSEQSRLLSGIGRLEFERSREILLRHLPPPPATILDIGGAAGIYSAWLASLNYRATVLDLVHKHTVQAHSAGLPSVRGDARSLPFTSSSCDAVLLMGPLYHLTRRPCRLEALTEALRVLRPGGIAIAAAITRHASLLAGLTLGLQDDPLFQPVLQRDLLDGQHRNPYDDPAYFTTAFFHLPQELSAEIQDAGFELLFLLPVEGPAWLAKDFDQTWDHPARRSQLLALTRHVEADPALLVLSPHLLAIARRP